MRRKLFAPRTARRKSERASERAQQQQQPLKIIEFLSLALTHHAHAAAATRARVCTTLRRDIESRLPRRRRAGRSFSSDRGLRQRDAVGLRRTPRRV